MKVKQLIKELKKMPQDLEVGFRVHDYDMGDSDSIREVNYIGDEEPDNDRGEINHPVIIE